MGELPADARLGAIRLRVAEVDALRDEAARSPLDLVVDTADVLADHAERQQLDATEDATEEQDHRVISPVKPEMAFSVK